MNLVVRAATAECAVSAMQNGADEILLAPSIPPESLGGVLSRARAGGVATTLDCTRACTDAELSRRAEVLRKLYGLGLDAVMVAEPGLLRMAALAAPSCKLIWGAPCHTHDDLQYAVSLKCARAVLSPFLSADAVKSLTASSPLPLLFWALTPLCPGGDPNLCLLDREHGAHDCALSCRSMALGYDGGADALPLKTRDLCLLKHLREFAGMTAIISPPDPTPVVAGTFTRLARAAADENYYDAREVRELFAALGREEPSDAPFTGTGSIYTREDMVKARNEKYWEEKRRAAAERSEQAAIPVRFFALIAENEPARLAVDDYKGHTLYTEGTVPLRDAGNPMTEEELNALWRDIPSPYVCRDSRTRIDPGLRMPEVETSALRKRALEKLTAARLAAPERKPGRFEPEARLLPRADKPVLTIRVLKMSQVTPELLSLPPERLYIPLEEASDDIGKAEWLVRSETVPVAVLPRVVADSGRDEIIARMKRLHDAGFREALVWNPGQAVFAVRHGFSPRADWSASSTQALKAAKSMGVISSTLAPWLSFTEILGMNHVTDTELVVYGRLPLLLARQCLIKGKSGICACDNKCELSDGQGGVLPLLRDCGHNTMVYHSQKLWMLPNQKQWRHLGLWAARLDFTTENARECVQVANAFAEREEYEPHTYTTGFYLAEEPKKRRGGRIRNHL